MGQDPFRGALRFSGGNSHPVPALFQRTQERPDARIHPVFKKSDRGVALTVQCRRLLRLLFGHAEVFTERVLQRRTDKLPERLRIRCLPLHFFNSIGNTVENAFLALRQRSIQIKNYTAAHSIVPSSVPKRFSSPASSRRCTVSSEITSPGTTSGIPGG